MSRNKETKTILSVLGNAQNELNKAKENLKCIETYQITEPEIKTIVSASTAKNNFINQKKPFKEKINSLSALIQELNKLSIQNTGSLTQMIKQNKAKLISNLNSTLQNIKGKVEELDKKITHYSEIEKDLLTLKQSVINKIQKSAEKNLNQLYKQNNWILNFLTSDTPSNGKKSAKNNLELNSLNPKKTNANKSIVDEDKLNHKTQKELEKLNEKLENFLAKSVPQSSNPRSNETRSEEKKQAPETTSSVKHTSSFSSPITGLFGRLKNLKNPFKKPSTRNSNKSGFELKERRDQSPQ